MWLIQIYQYIQKQSLSVSVYKNIKIKRDKKPAKTHFNHKTTISASKMPKNVPERTNLFIKGCVKWL